jgi:progranulin
MPPLTNLLALPASLLLLISQKPHPAVAQQERRWPYNLPAHVKYFPEDEPHVKRGIAAHELLVSRKTPVGVKKMSEDENEMFFLDYWQFDPAHEAELKARSTPDEEELDDCHTARLTDRSIPSDFLNDTVSDIILPPLLLHSNSPSRIPSADSRIFERSDIVARDFTCPSGYSNCSGIQRPNSCCQTGETCIIVADTGIGDVGCCPSGGSCAGFVQGCNTAAGYKSCPAASSSGVSGGGCCIPNYDCMGVGCELVLSHK